MTRARYALRCDDCAMNGWAVSRAAADDAAADHDAATGHHARVIDRGPAPKRAPRRTVQAPPSGLAAMFDLRRRP